MYLKSIKTKNVLFESNSKTIKQCVEEAVSAQVDLSYVNLRRANLKNAEMDGAVMHGACLWGANLIGANMAGGEFANADFRTSCVKETCFAESNLRGSDFSGAYFSGTIVIEADFSGARFSCPSIFSLDFRTIKNLEGAVYSHLGEIDCPLTQAPLVVLGLAKKLVAMDRHILIGRTLYDADSLQKDHAPLHIMIQELKKIQP